jgi:hypothetical protein
MDQRQRWRVAMRRGGQIITVAPGLDIVAVFTGEAVSPLQNASLQWLIGELYHHFSLTSSDVYRHPEVSYKNPDQASSAVWR